MKMPIRLMTHMVAYYPDRDSSMEVARALIDGGCSYLEIQFPFSDPTADGRYIQTACDRALKEGFKVSGGFDLLQGIRKITDIPIFIMCYANTAFYQGVENFLRKCLRSGAYGVIIPDLTINYDEGSFAIGKRLKLHSVPVIAPTVCEERLCMILHTNPEYIYAALRKGITGSTTAIGEENIQFLKKIRTLSGNDDLKILAGFGIFKKEQVELLSPWVHASIVGSAFIKEIMEQNGRNIYKTVLKKMRELLN